MTRPRRSRLLVPATALVLVLSGCSGGGEDEPAVEELLPHGEKPAVAAYLDRYVWLARRRLPQFARGTTAWWLEERSLA